MVVAMNFMHVNCTNFSNESPLAMIFMAYFSFFIYPENTSPCLTRQR